MVTDPMALTHADFCNDCFMLPDPRISNPDENQPGYPEIDSMVDLYKLQDVEDETKDLHVRFQNLPPPVDFQDPSYSLSNCRTMSLLPKEVLGVLYIMVNQRLIPDFWLRILRGEFPSPSIRQSILYLRQILMLNLALQRSRTTLSKVEWYFAMGYKILCQVDSTSCDDDCGICRQPLNEIVEEGAPVKTQCNHIFHMHCIGEWINMSPNGDCPACRKMLRMILEPIHDTPEQGPPPEWLVSLISPAPQVDPNQAILMAQELVQLEAVVEDAYLRVVETDQDLTDLQAELQLSSETFFGLEFFSEEHIQNSSELDLTSFPGLSEANFTRYQSLVRRHQMNSTQFATSYERLGELRREVDNFNDPIQRYRTATLALMRAEAEFLNRIIDLELE
ncbi:uncharacterized protein EAE97_007927 [Botrytis byssoidea]|uniref:RING-type domain-containing protein n=1 Tax=Botrytis byssoidea TaxID=139641 RepID=A0A9P5LRB7_9HELO|nr:uncharacterized protein EAE97_007927 [Botrytis byssoidea]KAF7936561.1 hypothetical protein EAE97_007927 [Botrytis byssoidea]